MSMQMSTGSITPTASVTGMTMDKSGTPTKLNEPAKPDLDSGDQKDGQETDDDHDRVNG